MSAGNSHIQDEMREVEEELEQDSSRHDVQNRPNSIPLEAVEEGLLDPGTTETPAYAPRSPTHRSASMNGRPRSPSPLKSGPSIAFPLSKAPPTGKKGFKEILSQARNSLQLLTNPVFAQAFILTFLGEWGDRSQITTIAMAGAHVSYRLSLAFFCLQHFWAFF